MENRNDGFAGFAFLHDCGHAAAHLVFDFLKHSCVRGKFPAQLRFGFPNRFGQILNLKVHDRAGFVRK
jgi:hypothetical protein